MTIRGAARGVLVGLALFFLALPAAQAAEYDRILSQMRQLQDSHPRLVQLFDFAANDQGEMVRGLKIRLPDSPANQPIQLVVGAHHGNERLSADLVMRFARDLIAGLVPGDEARGEGISRFSYTLIPVLNIGGFNANSRFERNKKGQPVDPNRDYPDPCKSSSAASFTLSSTNALAKYLDLNPVVGSVTVHGYIGTLTYPWGTFTDQPKTADHDLYHELASAAAAKNAYKVGTHGEVIYPTVGAFEDWAYFKHGVWVLLLELARSADLSKDSQALLTYFAKAPEARSNGHFHSGQCKAPAREFILSRP